MSFCVHGLKIGIFAFESLAKVSKNTLSGPLGEIYNQLFFDRRAGYFEEPLSVAIARLRAPSLFSSSVLFQQLHRSNPATAREPVDHRTGKKFYLAFQVANQNGRLHSVGRATSRGARYRGSHEGRRTNNVGVSTSPKL